MIALQCYHPQFTDAEAEAQRDSGIIPIEHPSMSRRRQDQEILQASNFGVLI